ncbi:hypothetical protein LCGC14_1952640 [marine sediment metagenome]|uniref:Uncharacterized protein n=1 Tax=marine sediment metagenome TaxID=412755 RepID=A0A0F9FGX0_9ZZZZ
MIALVANWDGYDNGQVFQTSFDVYRMGGWEQYVPIGRIYKTEMGVWAFEGSEYHENDDSTGIERSLAILNTDRVR